MHQQLSRIFSGIVITKQSWQKKSFLLDKSLRQGGDPNSKPRCQDSFVSIPVRHIKMYILLDLTSSLRHLFSTNQSTVNPLSLDGLMSMIIAKCRSWPYFDMSLFDFSWLIFTLQALRIPLSALDFNSVHDIDLLVYCQIISDIEDQNWSKVCRMSRSLWVRSVVSIQIPSKCLFSFLLTFTNWIWYNFKYSSILLLFFGLVLSWTLAAPFSSRCISDILWQKLHNTFTEQLFVSASTSYLNAKKRQSWPFYFQTTTWLDCFDLKKLYVSEIVLLSLYCRPS